MRSRRFDDARIAYLRQVPVVATLDALGIYWKRDATFEPLKDKATVRVHVSLGGVFRRDPGYAVELLNSILEDGDQGELLIALRQMADAFGGVRSVAKSAELNPSQLYRTLSDKGNPEVRSLTAILRAMGLRLAIQPIQSGAPAH